LKPKSNLDLLLELDDGKLYTTVKWMLSVEQFLYCW
jgi:hypothetical protein